MRHPVFFRRLAQRLRATANAPVHHGRRAALTGTTAAMLLPDVALGAGPGGLSGLSRAQLAVMVRGLAALRTQGDPRLDAEAARVLGAITRHLPEAPVLHSLHVAFRSGRHSTWHRPETRVDPQLLHDACLSSRPVSFDYVDRNGAATLRRVLPLELVHPQNGILLLAWCELRGGFRKFYVHAMDGLQVGTGSFAQRRAALLQGALDEELSRQAAFYES